MGDQTGMIHFVPFMLVEQSQSSHKRQQRHISTAVLIRNCNFVDVAGDLNILGAVDSATSPGDCLQTIP